MQNLGRIQKRRPGFGRGLRSRCAAAGAARLVDDGRLQVQEHGARHVLASAGLGEEGVERIVAAADGLVRRHLRRAAGRLTKVDQRRAGLPARRAARAGAAVRERAWPSGWMPCSRQYSSQQALPAAGRPPQRPPGVAVNSPSPCAPVWMPHWPMWMEITSRMVACCWGWKGRWESAVRQTGALLLMAHRPAYFFPNASGLFAEPNPGQSQSVDLTTPCPPPAAAAAADPAPWSCALAARAAACCARP